MTRKKSRLTTIEVLALTLCTATILLSIVLTLWATALTTKPPATVTAAIPVEIVKPDKTEVTTQPQTEPTDPTESAPIKPELDPEAVDLIARTIWGEAGGVKSKAERAAVAWSILNRVDQTGKSIKEVVTAPMQFQGYRPGNKWGDCPLEHYHLAEDVLRRWLDEKGGATDVGRVLPAEYIYFIGDGERNHFTTEFLGEDYWDWSLIDPYK